MMTKDEQAAHLKSLFAKQTAEHGQPKAISHDEVMVRAWWSVPEGEPRRVRITRNPIWVDAWDYHGWHYEGTPLLVSRLTGEKATHGHCRSFRESAIIS